MRFGYALFFSLTALMVGIEYNPHGNVLTIYVPFFKLMLFTYVPIPPLSPDARDETNPEENS